MKPDRKAIRDAWNEWLRKNQSKTDDFGFPFTAHYISFKAGFEAREKKTKVARKGICVK